MAQPNHELAGSRPKGPILFILGRAAEGCLTEGLVVGLVLFGTMLPILNKRVPEGQRSVGLLAGTAACSLTAVVMQMACQYDPFHALTHHFSAIPIMALIGVILAPWALRKV